MTEITKVNRRDVLRLFAAGSLTISVAGLPGCGRFGGGSNGSTKIQPEIYVSIAPDGQVTIVATRSEMGQGIRTSLPMIVADELEADWTKVNIRQATGDPRFGDQNTDSSASIRKLYQPMREVGATMRRMLIDAAANRWDVDASQCYAADHKVFHKESGRSAGYGELASDAARIPIPAQVSLKKESEFRYIGTSVKLVDVPDVVIGQAVYGIDVEIPGMKHAAIRRSPVVGGTVLAFDESAALTVDGVEQTIVLEAPAGAPGFDPIGGVAVIASNTWAAMAGRDRLEVEWSDSANSGYDSESAQSALRTAVTMPGRIVREEGDAESRLAESKNVIEAIYETPLATHVPMEPPACTASVADGKCEVWAPVQSPQRTRAELARALNLPEDSVTVNVTLLGGAFGRKAKPDFVLESALLSQKAGAPIKVTWSREDDVRHGYYHAMSAQYFKAAIGADGLPEAWLQRTAFPPIGSTFDLNEVNASESELRLGFIDNPYRIPNLRCENVPAAAGVRIGWLRSVCNIFHAFALNSFIDELADAAGADPLEYRLRLLGEPRELIISERDENARYPFNTGRLTGVLQRVAEMSDWKSAAPEGRGRGIAVHRAFNTYVAQVVDASVTDDGQVKVHHVYCAVDCGRVVNPGTAEAQIEGGIMNAISQALYSSITVREGQVREGNFNDYRLLRISEAPEITVEFIKSDEMPTGVGEPGVPPLAPALCGAIFNATGKRIRKLPIGEQLI